MKRQNEKEINEEISKKVIETISNDRLLRIRDFLLEYQFYKKYDKLYTTYIQGVRKALKYNKENKIYVDYRLEGTVTGRLSNAGYHAKKKGDQGKMGISFHTLPREEEDIDVNIRKYVVAPPGWKFITADYKGMETRIAAHLAKEHNMIKRIKAGEDIHIYSASMVYSKNAEKVSDIERQICKEVSFLIIYGGSEYTLAAKRRLSISRAKDIIERWLDTFPGIRRYMEEIFRFIEENKYAETMFGRRRHLPDVDSKIDSIKRGCLRQGLNFTVQSAASDILVCGLIGIDNELDKRGLSEFAYINGTVHDSVEVIAREDVVDEVISIIYDELVNYNYAKKYFGIDLLCPLEVEMDVGQSFGSGEKVDLSSLKSSKKSA